MKKRETRAERQARWDAESKAWRESGLAGGNLIEVGWLTRGMRGQYAYNVRVISDDFAFRDDEDDLPIGVRLFALVPNDDNRGSVAITASVPLPEKETR